MLKIGTIYRMPQPEQKSSAKVDGLDNFYFESDTPNVGFVFQKGIHNVKLITAPSGESRCPLIIISSTPRKAGSEDTPWHDRYDPDNGYVRYYGDNKYYAKPRDPEKAPGNKILLDLLRIYESKSESDRMKNAVPVIFFEKCSYDGRPKGNAVFHGFGILESAQLVTQYDPKNGYFANYQFDFCVLSLAGDNEQFNWQWIRDRCDPSKEIDQTLASAPQSWKQWLKQGRSCLHLVRRSVSGQGLVKTKDQVAADAKLLDSIYNYYGGGKNSTAKSEFEYLAMEATIKVIEETGAVAAPGWITPPSQDGGVDLVLRVDLGRDQLASVKIVLLGQAKCTKPNETVNGKDIARTVARLKRGWIGSFVTTSCFSESVQREVKEDSYPLMMINGAKLAEIVKHELVANGVDLNTYLSSLKSKYKRMKRMPEDVLDM